MSLRIIKHGIFDTFQDNGRYGYQHLGINPGGAMDAVAMKVVNALTGNSPGEAVLEMHFPAPELLFEQDALAATSGADFGATINKKPLVINRPAIIRKGSTLKFSRPVKGTRLYLAVRGGFAIDKWLGSYSTNLLVNAGGYNGNTLKSGDIIQFNQPHRYDSLPSNQDFNTLPFSANVQELYNPHHARFLPAPHHDLLTTESKLQLANETYTITKESDRMGYRLQSRALHLTKSANLISSAVTKGTIQLLPNGQIIILMADHQTTGGYPMIGHVISADLPTLAQHQAGSSISFLQIDLQAAERLLYSQHLHLLQLQNACNFRLKEFTS